MGLLDSLKGALESEALPALINTVLAQTQYHDLAGLVAADRAPAIWSMLHDNYEATPVYTDPLLGPFWELRRRPH